MQQIQKQVHKEKQNAATLAGFDTLPNSGFIRLPVVKSLMGVSSATVWRNVRIGKFPAPTKLSSRVSAWNVQSVRNALAEMGK